MQDDPFGRESSPGESIQNGSALHGQIVAEVLEAHEVRQKDHAVQVPMQSEGLPRADLRRHLGFGEQDWEVRGLRL